ncbi:MAG TPA: integrase, partial [Rhodopila sp.]|nr:integrase [Rhodopila sp.]
MMDTAATPCDYRDGLLLAVLAARGRRWRSMALLRVGRELILHEDQYRIELPAEQVKTRKPDQFDLPTVLTPYMWHYLAVIRPALLQSESHDALWVSPSGRPWTAGAIHQRV